MCVLIYMISIKCSIIVNSFYTGLMGGMVMSRFTEQPWSWQGLKVLLKDISYFSHNIHVMTRAITHHVVQQILTLYYKDTDEDCDDEFDDESCDSHDDGLDHIILFLQKLIAATEETGDHLRLCQKLEELKTSGGFGPKADMIYVDYNSRCLSSLSLVLEAFRDPERSLLVANMLADKLLSRSTTDIELCWGSTAELQSTQKNKPKKREIAAFFCRVLRRCCISKQDVDD